jgi:hypothetical protein
VPQVHPPVSSVDFGKERTGVVRGTAVRLAYEVAIVVSCHVALIDALAYSRYARFFTLHQEDLYCLFRVKSPQGLCHGMMETRSGFCHVAVETRQKILERISEILTVIQQKDWEQFRITVGRGAVVLANLARLSEVCAEAGQFPALVKKSIHRATVALGWKNCRKRACVIARSSSINNSTFWCGYVEKRGGSC